MFFTRNVEDDLCPKDQGAIFATQHRERPLRAMQERFLRRSIASVLCERCKSDFYDAASRVSFASDEEGSFRAMAAL